MDTPELRTLCVEAGEAGERLDRLLGRKYTDISRSRFKDLIEAGHARADGRKIVEARYRVKSGERIVITIPPPVAAEPEAEPIALDIVHEDTDIIVINKPAGLVVHPAAGNETGTLVNALIAHCGASLSGIGGVRRPGIVHRLDKDTSGLMVVAKTDRAHAGLAAQFAAHGRDGRLRRAYTALVWGEPPRRIGRVDAPIGRKENNRQKMAVNPKGRTAMTRYRVTGTYPPGSSSPVVSRIECTLETGRTHQIRVHMAHIGHPLLGDVLYGRGFSASLMKLAEPARTAVDMLGRQALHACELGFEHPASQERVLFHSALPEDLSRLVDALLIGGN